MGETHKTLYGRIIEGRIEIMFKKNKEELPTTWSPDMLKNYHELLKYNITGEICFGILEKHNLKSFGSIRTERFSYRGFIPISGLDKICVGLNPMESSVEEYQDYIGYIEILNGTDDDMSPLPLMRVFVKEDSGIFESVNQMLIESKIFNSKMFLNLFIYFDRRELLTDNPPEEMLNKKLPIKRIEISQTLSCFEWSDVMNIKRGKLGKNDS